MTRSTLNADALNCTFSVASPEDRAALKELTLAVYPQMRDWPDFADGFEGEFADDKLKHWALCRDGQGKIRLAMYVRANGVTSLYVNPLDVESAECRQAFLVLAQEVARILKGRCSPDLVIGMPDCLEPLGAALEAEGVLSRPTYRSRVMHFADQGEVVRTN